MGCQIGLSAKKSSHKSLNSKGSRARVIGEVISAKSQKGKKTWADIGISV